jgi:ADP-heptose:LPS heptosyltransferase
MLGKRFLRPNEFGENEMKSVLLFRLGGLGDLMITFPAIFLLREKLSSSLLTLVCREEYGLILKETGVVDEIVSLNHRQLIPLFSSPPYPEELSNWLEGFSLVLGWMQKENSLAHQDLCNFLSTKRCRFFVHDPDYQGSISKYFFGKTLEYLTGIEGPGSSFSDYTRLPISSNQRKAGLRLLGKELSRYRRKGVEKRPKIVVVHPGSGSKSKRWPLENFMEIIHQFGRKGYRGALVTGYAEAELENKLKKQILPKNWVWLRNPPLVKLSGLLSASSLYLGNDSGITHLAASCGTKVIALFQNDLESTWRPYGRVTVLSGESLSDISSASVWEKMNSLLDSKYPSP